MSGATSIAVKASTTPPMIHISGAQARWGECQAAPGSKSCVSFMYALLKLIDPVAAKRSRMTNRPDL